MLQHIRGNLFRGFEVAVIRRIAGQLLVALRTLAAEHIVHCDLKPENILLNAPNQLAVTVRLPGVQQSLTYHRCYRRNSGTGTEVRKPFFVYR